MKDLKVDTNVAQYFWDKIITSLRAGHTIKFDNTIEIFESNNDSTLQHWGHKLSNELGRNCKSDHQAPISAPLLHQFQNSYLEGEYAI